MSMGVHGCQHRRRRLWRRSGHNARQMEHNAARFRHHDVLLLGPRRLPERPSLHGAAGHLSARPQRRVRSRLALACDRRSSCRPRRCRACPSTNYQSDYRYLAVTLLSVFLAAAGYYMFGAGALDVVTFNLPAGSLKALCAALILVNPIAKFALTMEPLSVAARTPLAAKLSWKSSGYPLRCGRNPVAALKSVATDLEASAPAGSWSRMGRPTSCKPPGAAAFTHSVPGPA